MTLEHHGKRLIIGWREYIDFPQWGVERLLTKCDTGARSSAIDVVSIHRIANDRVRFDVALSRKDRERIQTVDAEISGVTRVRSSNGQIQERYKVETLVRVGDVDKRIEISLVCRRHMLCRVLLGRTALADDFLVEPEAKFLLSPPTLQEKKSRQRRRTQSH